MATNQETDTLRDVYAAINRNDVPAALKLFHAQIERIEPEGFPTAGTYRGIADVGAHLAHGRATWAEGRCEPETFLIAGDKIIAYLHVRVRLEGKSDWIEGRFADGFIFRDGKVAQMRTFGERWQARAWAGLPVRAAVVLGASGSVGKAVVEALISSGTFDPVVTLVRRPQAEQAAWALAAGVELREAIVSTMEPEALEAATVAAIKPLVGDVTGLSVLGIGAGTAKLAIDEHRQVDVHLNAAFARGLKASERVKHLAFMSAAGADPDAAETGSGAAGMARYARVKGEAEEAVKARGPAVISIFRPAMIIGSQHTPWLLEKIIPLFSALTPAKYKSITVEQIADAMVATSRDAPDRSAVYHYPEMAALAGLSPKPARER